MWADFKGDAHDSHATSRNSAAELLTQFPALTSIIICRRLAGGGRRLSSIPLKSKLRRKEERLLFVTSIGLLRKKMILRLI